MADPQPYDSALKSIMEDEEAEILPNLLPGVEYVSKETIEIDRTTLKADSVYNIRYRGAPHVLNMELQTDADSDMPFRMLKYHVGLYDKHRKPVISMIIYPFKTSIPEPPFREMSGEEALLTFHYRVLCLWKLDAQPFITDHVVSMYTLLPAMKGANATLLLQAISEMEQYYSTKKLGDHLLRFRTIMRRSGTLSLQDKQIIEERLHMFDSLLDQDPYLQKKWAFEKELGRAEGEIQGLRRAIVNLVKKRFPTLVDLAQQRTKQINTPDVLDQLFGQLLDTPDESVARQLLSTPLS